MTPFAQLEKIARINPLTAWNAMKGFGRGFIRAPGDAVNAASGFGRGEALSNLSLRGKELQGTAQHIGNLTGHLGLAGSGLFALDQAINGKDAPDGAQSARSKGFYNAVPPHMRDPLQGAGRTIIDHVKANPVVDSIVPDLDSLPSGFQKNQLLQLLRGPQTTKSAAAEITDPARDEKDKEDAAALRKRHILLALKRALQGAAVGGVAGAIATPEGGSPGGKTGALLGATGGALLGGGVGAAEGGIKRSIGIDPLLQTIATARRP